MTVYSIVLSCGHCKEPLGNLDVDSELSKVSPEEIIDYIKTNRITVLCNNCSCHHSLRIKR
jgi:hypothetical protein